MMTLSAANGLNPRPVYRLVRRMKLLSRIEKLDLIVKLDSLSGLTVNTCLSPLYLPRATVANVGVVPTATPTFYYHSVPGKRPWALKRNSRFWPVLALTRDINPLTLDDALRAYLPI